ncbi:CHAT domain-containing protein [Streptomyces sp. AK010]|nr:CHAT domain-containing protein [Streptomyces sp. AK010]MBB6421109.1 CHAT domain-containing protein [Streptomyces sp. AK010]
MPGRVPRLAAPARGRPAPLSRAQGRRRATLLDRTVSSLTSTLGVLAQARTRPSASPAAGTLVVALPRTPGAEPLGHAEKEAARVAELLRPAGPVTVLTGPAATSQSVLGALPGHGTAHFVCHGLTDPLDPSGSRLFLADHRERPLTVAVLAGLRLREADLAHLSACSTGVMAHRLADEFVHRPSSSAVTDRSSAPSGRSATRRPKRWPRPSTPAAPPVCPAPKP